MIGASVFAWMRLCRVVQKIGRAQSAYLRTWDLNEAQFDVLAQVGACQRITQQQLADKLLVTKGNVSQLLNRMENLGLLARCPVQRNNTLSLTEKGQQLHDIVVPAIEQLITDQFSTLPASEVLDLLRILRKLDRSLP
jgi:DNA-binding MarR family transcriptional regulator